MGAARAVLLPPAMLLHDDHLELLLAILWPVAADPAAGALWTCALVAGRRPVDFSGEFGDETAEMLRRFPPRASA